MPQIGYQLFAMNHFGKKTGEPVMSVQPIQPTALKAPYLASAPQKADSAPDEFDARMMDQAKKFEAAFVSQMLKYAGLTEAITSDSGKGGDAFSSMLVDQYSQKIVENGGFGLAEKIYDQMILREGNNNVDSQA